MKILCNYSATPQDVHIQIWPRLVHYSSAIHVRSSSNEVIFTVRLQRSDAINSSGCHDRDCMRDGISSSSGGARVQGYLRSYGSGCHLGMELPVTTSLS
jgi:hypothetical protein